MSTDRKAIWVPMRMDAYLNIDGRQTVKTDPRSRAYLAPINTPDYNGLQSNDGLIQHDIFEHHRDAPYMGCADPERQLARRQGVYLHWTLPRLYRTGVAAAGSDDSVAATTQALKLGGYPTAGQAFSGTDTGTPIFRPIPERWIIMRTIRPCTAGPFARRIMITSTGQDEIDVPSGIYNGVQGDTPSINDLFVVQCDIIRSVTDLSPLEDIEVTSTPLIDPNLPAAQQGQSFQGQTCPWRSWTGDDNNPNPNPPTITVSRAANPYFADYQPQNPSIFSIFDDLLSTVGNVIFRYTQASISYTVLGYHTLDENDPLFIDSKFCSTQTFADRLSRCNLTVANQLNSDDSSFLAMTSAGASEIANMRTLLQGSMYGLPWSNSPKEGQIQSNFVYPGDQIQQLFTNTHPVSVGTNPIDALFAWLKATNDTSGVTSDQIRSDLLKIQTLVMDSTDTVDNQLMASDLMSSDNFVPRIGGTTWHFKAPEGVPSDTQPTIPTEDQADGLRKLNALQLQLNSINREQDRLKASLFATYWTYITDKDNPDVNATTLQQNTLDAINGLKTSIRNNYDDLNDGAGLITNLQNQIATLSASLGQVQAGTEANFYTQRDPTLFIAGLSSKWPADWDQPLNVRLNPQNFLGDMSSAITWPPLDTDFLQGKVPQSLASPMVSALGEGLEAQRGTIAFENQSPYWKNGDRSFNANTGNYENGWFPLFIEWELEYYHIPFENWEFGPQGAESRIGYSLRASTNPAVPAIQSDYRIINGRCPVMPQAGSVLSAKLSQVFSKIDSNSVTLSASDKAALLSEAKGLDFASAPLTGLTDQLLTQMQGMHATPLTRSPQGIAIPTNEAYAIGGPIGLTGKADFYLMRGQMSKTPFASSIDIPTDVTTYNPFKPCTHGQFRFTKLNVVDKFGQIVQGVQLFSDTGNAAGAIGLTATPLFPCLGEFYSVEQNTDGTAQIVLPRTDNKCNFVQLPPSINQDARVNTMFLTQDMTTTPPSWRRMDEWENPVRGWLIINQANISIQVFTPDGHFIREFGVAYSNPISRPFAVDQTLLNSLDPILQGLLTQFTDHGWLSGFFRSITSTTETIQANPSSYAESMLSILGRPLAVTAFGINLELADPPKANLSTIGNTVAAAKDLTSYNFNLKIGDKDNVFDGLYGLFTAAPDLSNGIQINFQDFYTYHPPDPSDDPIVNDPSRSMPTDFKISPFYPDPHSSNFSQARMGSMEVFAGIIDPFSPLNCYTALLPIQQLKLPPWTIDFGLKEIAAFFKMGPFLVASDVPPFDGTKVVNQDYRLDDQAAPASNGSIPIPAVGIGDWGWLQPYPAYPGPAYNVLDVTQPSEKPLFEDAPYTVVEGFLQQKKPFTQPETLPT